MAPSARGLANWSRYVVFTQIQHYTKSTQIILNIQRVGGKENRLHVFQLLLYFVFIHKEVATHPRNSDFFFLFFQIKCMIRAPYVIAANIQAFHHTEKLPHLVSDSHIHLLASHMKHVLRVHLRAAVYDNKRLHPAFTSN